MERIAKGRLEENSIKAFIYATLFLVMMLKTIIDSDTTQSENQQHVQPLSLPLEAAR